MFHVGLSELRVTVGELVVGLRHADVGRRTEPRCLGHRMTDGVRSDLCDAFRLLEILLVTQEPRNNLHHPAVISSLLAASFPHLMTGLFFFC